MPDAEPLVRLRGISKDYRGLRPLRVASLDVHAGRSLALIGFDPMAAEVLVNLMTGFALPDTGEVVAFGQRTADIADGDAWMKTLDRFGLVSDRAVLVEQFTVEQNLAMPFSLEVEEMPDDVRLRARQLADEIGLTGAEVQARTGDLSPASRLRLRLGRALALAPSVLVAEHPNASLSGGDTPAFAADFTRIVERRGLASVVLTADRTFASSVAEEVLTLEPATGALKPSPGWRRWFS
jgi:ABC-type transporter Mla maintaining outer membrane lipid asymmetry ATPase subunit MlaF